MTFKKGYIPTEEQRRRQSKARMGKIPWNKNLKGVMPTPWNKDKNGIFFHSEESRKKISQATSGEKNPFYDKKHSEESKKKMSEKGKLRIKEKNSQWQDGKSFEPYGVEFDNKLREQIRTRDSYRCQECFRHQSELRTKNNKPRKLVVHHIDYNKKNNNPNNLISLCLNCHLQTNWKRDDWTNYFKIRGDSI